MAPPPVDLSVLSLRQRDQRHGNPDWFGVGRRRVCGGRPPHLTSSGRRCLGQVLVLSQVELLSEHIKDSHGQNPGVKMDYLKPVSVPGVLGDSHK